MSNAHSNGSKPAVDLDHIVEALSPDAIAKKVIEPHRKIRIAYKIEKPSVSDYQNFMKQITAYVKHHWKEFYKAQISDDHAFGEAHSILEQIFEKEGGVKHAFEIARHGKLDEVIDALSNTFENKALSHYMTSQTRTSDPNDLEGQTKIVAAVMEKYKPFLPKGKKLEKPEFYASKHQDFIQLYLNAVRQAGTMTRYEPPKKDHAAAGH